MKSKGLPYFYLHSLIGLFLVFLFQITDPPQRAQHSLKQTQPLEYSSASSIYKDAAVRPTEVNLQPFHSNYSTEKIAVVLWWVLPHAYIQQELGKLQKNPNISIADTLVALLFPFHGFT